MPGKISELGSLIPGEVEVGDAFEVLDVDDTSMAPTGTNKKMTLTDLWTWMEVPVRTIVAEGTDWDTVIEPGMYLTEYPTDWVAQHAPADTEGTLIVSCGTTTAIITQQWCGYVNNRSTLYVRVYSAGNWRPWSQGGVLPDSTAFLPSGAVSQGVILDRTYGDPGYIQWGYPAQVTKPYVTRTTSTSSGVGDCGKVYVYNNSGAASHGCGTPPSGFIIGYYFDLIALGTGSLSVNVNAGATLNGVAGASSIVIPRYSIVRVVMVAADVWVASVVANASVSNAQLATMPTLTVKGNSTGATAAPSDLTVAQLKTMLALSGADLSSASVTNTQLATMATLTIKGNATGGTAAPTDLTVAQARSMVASGAGALFGFDFDTTTSAGSAVTRLRLNNATPASATIVYVSYTSKDGVDLKARLLAGTAGDRLFIQERANSANYRVYELLSAPTDNTTYATCSVIHRSGGGSLWANSAEIIAGFVAAPFTVGTTAPTSPSINDLWVDTT